ncbi:MAG: hypothetical protein II984_00455 [Clostridia bacterium]|nr:hypothetical protein [Clostridia bacterium]
MKKLSLILILCIALLSILTITAFAEETEEVTPTEGTNIAPEATLSTTSGCWVVSSNLNRLVDGKYGSGMGSSHNERDFSVYFTYDRFFVVDKLIVYVNQEPEDSYSASGDQGLTAAYQSYRPNFGFTVVLYDENNKRVFQKDYKTENQTAIVIEPNINTPIYKIEYWDPCGWNNTHLVWEIEVYEHYCHFDTLKQTLKEETCVTPGEGIYECKCGKTEQKEIPPTNHHDYRVLEAMKYENSFLNNGIKTLGCPTCDESIEVDTQPLFKFLGYSVSRSGKSICVSYTVNKEDIAIYETANDITFDYGIVCAVTDNISPLTANGKVTDIINGQSRSLKDTTYPRFDIKISANDWTNISNTPLIMCAYIIDGGKLSYICSETNTENAIPLSYSQINLMPI